MAGLGPWLVIYGHDGPGEPEVTKGDLAVIVYQDVRRFQVPVRNIRRMQVLDRT